jgi:ESCRT-II complex subunit VPS36
MTTSNDYEPSWSPFMALPEAQVTPSGLLKLDVDDGEVELMRREGMELRAPSNELMPAPTGGGFATWVDRNTQLKTTLTTHRIVFQSTKGSSKQHRFLHLSNVHASEGTGGGALSWSSPKISLSTYALGELLLCFRGSHATTDQKDFLALLQKTCHRKAWEDQTRLHNKTKTSTKIASRKVGVDAILTKSALRHKEAATLAERAFQGDAEDLLREATELVTIIHKYVVTLEEDPNREEESTRRLGDMMSDMGMTSALSKDAYRGKDQNEFYEVLARQLADFLRPRLKLAGGVMTLTDVYCLYNRARGTNLISPEDLLTALQYLDGSLPELGISQREFPSGLKVVQSMDFSDERMAVKLKDLSVQRGNLTALQASKELHISVLLAHEQLLAAERKGYLCRDVTLETTRFYPNRFVEFCRK